MADPMHDAAEPLQYLSFSLGEDAFALEITVIREIIRSAQLASVPMTPPHIRGVINLRGAVLPVIDLAVLFERAPIIPTKRTSIIVVESREGDTALEFGIMVDSVSAVIEIDPSQIEPPPSFGAPVRTDYVAGIGKLDGQFLVILNPRSTFSVSHMAADSAAAA